MEIDMKMNDKKLQVLAEELDGYSNQTLKYLLWTLNKLCTVIELSSDKEWIEYKLQPLNEGRDSKNGDPAPEQEARVMKKLQNYGFFEFQSAWLGADKPIVFGGEDGLTGEVAIRMANDPRSKLEMKYEWGWLENPDLDTLQGYLALITKITFPNVRQIPCRFENNAFFITLKNGTEKSITFETRRDTRYMLALFKVLYEHWQRFGNEPLEKGEIRRRMRKEGVTREISDNFIKNIVSNIRKKINSVKLSSPVILGYDRASNGYYLDIKIPS